LRIAIGIPGPHGQAGRSIVIGIQGRSCRHLAGFQRRWNRRSSQSRYELEYLNYAGTNTHWSLLSKVTLVGATASRPSPATHGYTVSNPPDVLSAAGEAIGGTNEPPWSWIAVRGLRRS